MGVNVSIDRQAVKNGLVKKVGGVRNFAILSVIAAHVNEKGESEVSQREIAESIGYSRKTVNEAIKELRERKIDDEPILVLKKKKSGNGVRNVYLLSTKSGFSIVTKSSDYNIISNNNIKDINKEIIFNNAKEVLQYFREKFYETYNAVYQPNWARDMALIKRKLMTNFTDLEIKNIIDVVFEEYDSRWANTRFPRPSIGQLCTWLPNEVMAIIQERKEAEERTRNSKIRYELSEEQFERLLDEI